MNSVDPTQTVSKKNGLNGYHVLMMFVAFFGVIIIVNFTMAWLASNTWTGLVVKNTYVASQEYNEQIELAKQQKAMGWKTEFSYEGDELKFLVTGKNDLPGAFANVYVELGRPVAEQNDVRLELKKLSSGTYGTQIGLSPGLWSFRLVAEGINNFRADGRFVVNDKGKGTLE